MFRHSASPQAISGRRLLIINMKEFPEESAKYAIKKGIEKSDHP
jgi:hypothetical protein